MSIDDHIPCASYLDTDERIEAQANMKIGIFRALQLGDLLCCIPAVRALRQCYPKADITLFGLPWADAFVKRFLNYFDHFMHFPGYPGLPEQTVDAAATIKFMQAVQAEEFDLILQMQGNGSIVNPMVALLGAKYIGGFYTQGHYYPNNGLFLEYPEKIHEIERHIKLIENLNVQPAGTDLEFPLFDEDWEALQQLHLSLAYKNYVCIHAGSRGAWRQWPTENFAAVADYCAAQNMKVVLTGTADELAIVKEVAKQMQYEPIIVAGRTSLGAMAALIKNSYALISNCTGVSHIAAALQTPSVVLSMDGEPERWAPLNTKLHHTIDWTTTPDIDLVFEKLALLFHNDVSRKAA